MNLLVLGATGKTGREVMNLALSKGHSVTAFVRSPHKISQSHARLRVRKGDALDVDALAIALEGQDAVLSALGQPPRQALRPSTFMAESAANTVAAMQRARVRRLAILSAAVLFPGHGIQFAFFRWFLRHHARDLSAMETVVKATDLDWTIARPPRLVRSDDARYQSRRDGLPNASLSVSFRGVAAFLLASVEEQRHIEEIVGVAR
jgi:putative NADH-flavin reductase